MFVQALHLRADGTYSLFEYDPHDDESLELLQARVGGWLESAPIIDRTLTMYCNEEGKIQGLPLNEYASILLGPDNPDWIAGDVVLVGAPDKDGYDTSLSEEFLQVVRSTQGGA